MNEYTRLPMFAGAAALALSLVACKPPEGPAERAGKQVDQATEKVSQQVDKSAEKVKDKVEDAKR